MSAGTNGFEIKEFSDPQAMALAAAELIQKSVASALAHQPCFTLVLSGGETPLATYGLLADSTWDMEWDRIHLFMGDERVVPFEHPDSNFGRVQQGFINRILIPDENVHPLAVLPGDAFASATQSEERLKAFFHSDSSFRDWPCFDLMLLGMGTDGHVASLFPGHPALMESQRWVTQVMAPAATPAVDRISLTLPVINSSKAVLGLVRGRAKKGILAEIEQHRAEIGQKYPAALVRPAGKYLWFVCP